MIKRAKKRAEAKERMKQREAGSKTIIDRVYAVHYYYYYLLFYVQNGGFG